ncbi:Sfum_1244 family protein [Desulfonatronum thiodismutans]|uniref:Sfum_1244 family protein n=1 Tax=Desulfonatronum thiodismutans TaxID=159290 RepID=UPI0004ABE931|nr:Sfum_1244 family protein [Desulfonatronum thiodismutans]
MSIQITLENMEAPVLTSMQALREQIQRNCAVSDANFSGAFSLCGLLLRMRELYKWEAGLPPWKEPEHGLILDWVEQREDLWQELEGRSCETLCLEGEELDPFEVERINQRLASRNLLYGAGYVLGMKPSFLLAEPVESQLVEGLRVYTVDRELCRDIFATPVMRQGERVIARRQAMAFLIWDVIQEQRPSVRPALGYALAGYGLNSQDLLRQPGAHGAVYQRMVAEELRVWVYHEIGEALEDAFPGDVWHQMVANTCQTLAEVFIRAVKDLLADTHPQGLLARMIQEDRKASLGLYLAMMRPLSKMLFPDIFSVFPDFVRSGNWSEVDQARGKAHVAGRNLAARLVDIHAAADPFDHARTVERIIEEVIRPLGIVDGMDVEAE